MKKYLLALAFTPLLLACQEPSSDRRMVEMQEQSLTQGVSAVGMPAIKNWREKRLLKMIYELRDQDGLRTYTYLVAQQSGERKFLCDSIGFPINDAIGYSSPEKMGSYNGNPYTLTQAEPNGLFTPDTSNSYWVMCMNTEEGKPSPVFVTGYPLVSTFKLN